MAGTERQIKSRPLNVLFDASYICREELQIIQVKGNVLLNNKVNSTFCNDQDSESDRDKNLHTV